MRELSLFTGAGGGVLGSKILGWRTLGYVEKDPYCQKIIAQRIADGIFDNAPLFADIKLFLKDGFADQYRGIVDVVTAGFPCQPFSVAGKRAGKSDERNLWPETIECIRRVRPRFAFLENVPGLLSSGYFGKILGDLAENGFDAEWAVLGAHNVGASHIRKRIWILAHTNSERFKKQCGNLPIETPHSGIKLCCKNVANSERAKIWDRQDQNGARKQKESVGFGNSSWWLIEPAVGRMAHGMADRVNRLKAIGNGQVPLQMAYAFSKLFERIAGGTS